MTPILANTIYGETTTKTFPIRIRTHNRQTTKRTTDHRPPAMAHHPVPVAVDRDRNHFRAQIHNINPGRLVVSTENRNRPAMVEVAVNVPVHGIVNRFVRRERDREADHRRHELANILMGVVVRISLQILFLYSRNTLTCETLTELGLTLIPF